MRETFFIFTILYSLLLCDWGSGNALLVSVFLGSWLFIQTSGVEVSWLWKWTFSSLEHSTSQDIKSPLLLVTRSKRNYSQHWNKVRHPLNFCFIRNLLLKMVPSLLWSQNSGTEAQIDSPLGQLQPCGCEYLEPENQLSLLTLLI